MPNPRSTESRRKLWIARGLAWLIAAWIPCAVSAADDRTGEQIYRQDCARCHGASGEGSEDYPEPLAGDRSVGGLAKLIAKTMPADDPGTCQGEDAQKVAAYIYEAFYSPAARVRNAPPRIELSRLTVRQYQNTVADLIGTFRDEGHWGGERGLKAEYYKSRRFRDEDRVIERVDPEVRFDFGVSAPDPEKFEPREFSIRWQGSVLAPETGEYEFVVRTEHATRLWVNDPRRPLIDAWVKSGNETEYRGSIFLLGGRPYTLRLEFSKAKQGVDDSDKQKEKPPPVPASIALAWKPPGQVEEIIPARNLGPERSPETFVLRAPFPPDDRSVGYERGTSVSKAWDEATTEAAIEVAGYVSSRLRDLAGVRDDQEDRKERLREFGRRFAERAFRRPLDDEAARLYVDRQFEGTAEPEVALKRVILLVLKSPRFLFHEVGGGPEVDSHDVASRLSFALWDSLPDRELLEAAKSGRLLDRDEVARQAERMVGDLRARAKLRGFLHQWLKLDPVPDLAKDPGLFPGFDKAVASDLRTSLELFLDEVLWGERPDFRQLLLSDALYLNGRLAKFYGVDLPENAPFQKVPPGPVERAGILTHPYLLSNFAYTATSSPIHRGVFLARNVLGRALRPPPEAFTPLAPELHPDLTTRERVTLQTSPEACVKCHGLINGLGFGLEHFDAVGRWRDAEKGKPIDATGVYESTAGEATKFSGARDLATFLADSEEVHEAFVENLFHALVKQPTAAYGPRTLPDLRLWFASHEFDVRALMVEIATAAATKSRMDEPTKTDP